MPVRLREVLLCNLPRARHRRDCHAALLTLTNRADRWFPPKNKLSWWPLRGCRPENKLQTTALRCTVHVHASDLQDVTFSLWRPSTAIATQAHPAICKKNTKKLQTEDAQNSRSFLLMDSAGPGEDDNPQRKVPQHEPGPKGSQDQRDTKTRENVRKR